MLRAWHLNLIIVIHWMALEAHALPLLGLPTRTPQVAVLAAALFPHPATAILQRTNGEWHIPSVIGSGSSNTPATGKGTPREAAQGGSGDAGAHGVTDPTCHARLHTDYMGESAPVWGLGNPGFHLSNAAECCAACQAHNEACGKGPESHGKSWWPARPEMKCGPAPGCNIWVFCPEDQCFAFDIHVHKFGECWLKHQRADITAPKDPHEGHQAFPEPMRKAPRNVWPWAVDSKIWPGGIPEYVPWISGVIAPADAVITSARADDPWRKNWCEKNGATYGQCD